MNEKLKKVIRLINELQLAMKEDPDILSAYITMVEDTDIPQLQLYKGYGIEFTEEKKYENGVVKKSTVIDGVRVIKVYLEEK